MKRRQLLEAVQTASGELTLHRHDRDYTIQIDRQDLMSSRRHGSETELARLALSELPPGPARILIGGLGMGYTLRAALDALGDRADSTVTVAEVYPEVIDWNRRYLAALAGAPLADRRVRVWAADVRTCLEAEAAAGAWEAILLDVDNGPSAFTLASNQWLYGQPGLRGAYRCLVAGGVLAVWSAYPDRTFLRRLQGVGFGARSVPVPAREGGKGGRHVLFLGRRP